MSGLQPTFFFENIGDNGAKVFVETNVQNYREKIRELTEALLAAEGMELVDVECLRMKSRWLVRIFMDKEEGGRHPRSLPGNQPSIG